MLKNLIRIIIILGAATLGILIGEGLNAYFGGVDYSFSPIVAIVFSLAASCVIICESKRK